MPAVTLHRYLQTVDLSQLLRRLEAENVEVLVEEIKHFTVKEAKKRDRIVLSYFGQDGIKRMTEAIASRLTTAPKLRTKTKILDMGAGSGFFTTRVAHELKKKSPDALFYAMDATPAMLLAIERKAEDIIPFLGVAENITGSIKEAKNYASIPKNFDVVFSTLMLHHCPDISKVFHSIKEVLKPSGKAVIIDLCTHSFKEFKDEMSDIHLGFDLEQIRRTARKVFSQVSVEVLPGICCESSGRSAQLFIATARP